MPHVFISYLREDTERVDRLARVLRGFGVDVWLDRDQIRPGQRWADAIRTAIREGAFYIACFSNSSAARSRSYMNEELVTAIEELRLRPADQAWFIPVLLDGVEVPDRPIGGGETLRSLQWVALHDDWERGVSSILSVIRPDAVPVRELISAMQGDSARAKIRAIDNVAGLGKLARDTVPTLLDALDDHNETVRAAAADALGRVGSASPSVISKLLNVMRKGDFYDSRHAARSLAELGEAGVVALLQATQFTAYGVASHATDAISDVGKQAIPALVSVARGSSKFSAAALSALSRINDPAAVPDLIDALRDDDSRIRLSAATAFSEIGRYHRDRHCDMVSRTVTSLIDAIRDVSVEVRLQAIRSLGDFEERAAPAVPALTEALNDDYLRTAAADALGRIGPPAHPAWPKLVDLATESVGREAVILALGRIGAPAEQLVPLLKQALVHQELRVAAATALGDLGPDSANAIPELMQLLTDRDKFVRWESVNALGKIGPDAATAVPTLLSMMSSSDYALRLRIATALGLIGDRRSIPILIRALTDNKETHALAQQVRTNAVAALARIGDPAVVPHLIPLLDRPDLILRAFVEDALAGLGTPPAP